MEELVDKYCPTIMRIMRSIVTTQRQEKEASNDSLDHKGFVSTFSWPKLWYDRHSHFCLKIAASAAVNLLGERSQSNSYCRHVLGLYLYSTGATRQQISVLNHLGFSVSYPTLAGRGGKIAANAVDNDIDDAQELINNPEPTAAISAISAPQTKKKKRTKQRPGTLEFLSESMREVARLVAATGMFLTVYDNINMVWKVAEQIVGRTGEHSIQQCPYDLKSSAE